MNKPKSKRGLTLIEFLIIIFGAMAIVGFIITAMLMTPLILKALERLY